MNLNNYYLHAIKDNKFYPSKDAIKKLESILEKNNILSRRLQNYKSNYLSFNGLDYISLCDPSKPREGYSAFNYFIKTSLSLVISKDIDVVNPEKIDIVINKPKDLQKYTNSNIRYTNFKDEVQVENNIQLSNIVAITIPLSNIINPFKSKKSNKKTIIKELNILKELLIKHNFNKPIYDIETLSILDNENNIDKIIIKKKTS
ncbi:MAG: hypothetical protein PHN54_01880 [Bacilli bacterium]|nr:hypothetical protein [Bacilli bacterium]